MQNANLQQLVVSFNGVKNCKLVESKHTGHDVNDTVCTSDVSPLNPRQNVSILNVDIWSKKVIVTNQDRRSLRYKWKTVKTSKNKVSRKYEGLWTNNLRKIINCRNVLVFLTIIKLSDCEGKVVDSLQGFSVG